MGVPDFKLYYWAAQLQWLARWLSDMNKTEVGNTDIGNKQGALIWRMIRNANPIGGDPRLLTVALKCWDRCRKDTKDILKYAPEIPLVGMPKFQTRMEKPYFTSAELAQWTEADILTIGNLLETGTIMTFDAMVDIYNIPVGQFLKYEELKVSIRELWAGELDEPSPHTVLRRLLTVGRGRHLITWIYKALGTMHTHALEHLEAVGRET